MAAGYGDLISTTGRPEAPAPLRVQNAPAGRISGRSCTREGCGEAVARRPGFSEPRQIEGGYQQLPPCPPSFRTPRRVLVSMVIVDNLDERAELSGCIVQHECRCALR